jgi:hypothetical protein
VVDWLSEAEEETWADQVREAKQCLSELEDMARLKEDPSKPDSHSAPVGIVSPYARQLQRAIPLVRAMIHAIQARNRKQALESGKEALMAL